MAQKSRVTIVAIFYLSIFLLAAYAMNPQARDFLRKAEFFFEKGDIVSARNFCLRAKSFEPNLKEILDLNAEIDAAAKEEAEKLRSRAEFFLSAKNLPEAEKLLKKVLLLTPDDSLAKARHDQINQAYSKIDEYKNKGITVDLGSGRAHDVDLYSAVSILNRARAFFERGDREKALEFVMQVLEREPGYKPALELKTQIENVNEIETYVNLAEKAFRVGKMQDCLSALDRLIKEMPDRSEFLLMRAKAQIKLKEPKVALADIWAYREKSDKDVQDEIFPLLAQANFELKNYNLAYGFSFSSDLSKTYMPFSFRYKCYIGMYGIKIYFIYFLILLIVVAIFVNVRMSSWFMNRFPAESFTNSVKCFWYLFWGSPERALDLLVVTARTLNTAWLNYLAGITLFQAGQIEGAQRFLAFSFTSKELAARAYYFFGLTKKELKQEFNDSNFEESILFSCDKGNKTWHPGFMKKMEVKLLDTYSREKSFESFEGLAYVGVKDQIGVKE
jgi:tetratricopeptide (TPR) repeat protein